MCAHIPDMGQNTRLNYKREVALNQEQSRARRSSTTDDSDAPDVSFLTCPAVTWPLIPEANLQGARTRVSPSITQSPGFCRRAFIDVNTSVFTIKHQIHIQAKFKSSSKRDKRVKAAQQPCAPRASAAASVPTSEHDSVAM